MENVSIGVIDSGVGGLSIFAAIKLLAPSLSLTYLADSTYVPYGSKTPEFITTRAVQLVSFLKEKDIQTIVIACNTITVTALRSLREAFPEISFIGTVPVVKPAAEHSKTKHIGVLSTRRTTESAYLEALVKQFATECTVTSVGTDALVPLVEEGKLEGKDVEDVVREVVAPFMSHACDTVVLGCTHFPFLKPMIQRVLGEKVTLLDSGEAVAKQLLRVIEEKQTQDFSSGGEMFFTTGEAEMFHAVVQKLLYRSITESAVRHVDIV